MFKGTFVLDSEPDIVHAAVTHIPWEGVGHTGCNISVRTTEWKIEGIELPLEQPLPPWELDRRQAKFEEKGVRMVNCLGCLEHVP